MMVAVVWKADLSLVTEQFVKTPEGAEFLHIALQHGKPVIWFRCNPEKPVVMRKIAMTGTGHTAPSDAPHIGTILLANDVLVLHFFSVDGRPTP